MCYNITEERERKVPRMDIVNFGKKWIIKTREDYENALRVLDGNEFCAEMSDDLYNWRREKAEVAAQRADVRKQAVALGIV